MKIGIFGGSFNPPHFGHVNVVKSALEKAGLHKIFVIPNWSNPLKNQVDGPLAEHRLAMTRAAFADMGSRVEVLDLEVKKGTVNYTTDTLETLKSSHPGAEFSLILGADLLPELPQWKNWKELLTTMNFVVTSRPGFEWSSEFDGTMSFLKPFIEDSEFNFVSLKGGKEIQFLQLKDIDVSATRLRKKLSSGKSVGTEVPLGVEAYIRDQRLYAPLTEKIKDYEKFTEFCADQLFAKKGIQVLGYDLRNMNTLSEFALIGAGTSTRHTTSLAENLIRSVKEEYNVFPLSVEGTGEGRWVLIDYGTLIVHVFYDFVRREYSLESLWSRGKMMNLLDKSLPSPSTKA
jgi:nicotinate-nucleotide adenylyltransferase